jgi:hypothetical protein
MSDNVLSARQVNTNEHDGTALPIPCDYSPNRSSETQIYSGLEQAINLHHIQPDSRMQMQMHGSNGALASTTWWGTGTAGCLKQVDLIFEYAEIAGVV